MCFDRSFLADDDMQDHNSHFCAFRELSALVVTWNAGAATPTHLRYDDDDTQSFMNILKSNSSSDLIVFGFQELIDLDDKKVTASKFDAFSKPTVR